MRLVTDSGMFLATSLESLGLVPLLNIRQNGNSKRGFTCHPASLIGRFAF